MKKSIISYHAKIIIRGLVRVIWGALTAGLIGLAVYGFVAIPNEGGYVAVCDFIAAVATMVVALGNVYFQGIGSFRKAKKCADGR